MCEGKTQFGYFALPVLVGDDIVAAIGSEDRPQTANFLMQKWSWVGKASPRKAMCARISSAASRTNWTGSSVSVADERQDGPAQKRRCPPLRSSPP